MKKKKKKMVKWWHLLKKNSFAAFTHVFCKTVSCGHYHFEPTWTDTATILCFPSHIHNLVQSFLHLHFCALSGELDLRNWDELK